MVTVGEVNPAIAVVPLVVPLTGQEYGPLALGVTALNVATSGVLVPLSLSLDPAELNLQVEPVGPLTVQPAAGLVQESRLGLLKPAGTVIEIVCAALELAVALTVTVKLVIVLGAAVVGEIVTAGASALAGPAVRPTRARARAVTVSSANRRTGR